VTTRRRLRDPALFGVVGCGVLVVGYYLWRLFGLGGMQHTTFVTDLMYGPLCGVFTALGVGVCLRPDLDRRTRNAWRLITFSLLCELVAHGTWFVEDALLHRNVYPAIADYLWLIFPPFMLVGLVMLPGAKRTRDDRIRLALDTLIVGASGFMVLWYLVLGQIFNETGASLFDVVFAAALPLFDLLLLMAVAATLLRRMAPAARAPLHPLALAMAAFVVADVSYGYISLNGGFIGGAWPDYLWMGGCYLLVVATYRQYRQDGHAARDDGRRRVGINLLPYGGIAVAYALLVVVARRQGMYPFGGMVLGAVALTSLVVARQMLSLRENQALAVTDVLTGLANRALLTERLAQLTAHPLRDGQHSAVLLVDLNLFKPINDRYGHTAGDTVLQAVADRLRSAVRPSDTVGRLGGDEFAVILTGLPARDIAEVRARQLIAALRAPVPFGEHLLQVEASIGVAIRDDTTDSGDVLLQHADTAMYAAKRAGDGRPVVYSEHLDLRARDAELRQAVLDGEFVVHYQPVVDLDDSRITTIEALVRWAHPTRGLLTPADFITLAEETGAIVPLGTWVLRAACTQLAEWYANVPRLRSVNLSVNLSTHQVIQADLVDVVRGILDETGFPPGHLVLELTESGVLQPDPPTIARLEELRDMGVRIAVDDFGTGFSALSYLRNLPVSILKIDKSFVTGIEDDPDARTVAEAVVRLGAAFRLDVIAEGIESPRQASALREMGCRFGQGYHFYRPLNADNLLRTLVADVSAPARSRLS
jgi:diguanylate cyclase (GGDEF)-like protein